MSIKKLIEQTRNERMTEPDKIKELNKFFENSEANTLLQELKNLDLLNKTYTDIIDTGWNLYRVTIYPNLSITVDKYDKIYCPWHTQMATTFDGDISKVTIVKPNASVKDILHVLKIAFFSED
jgi:hypothetical protein